MGRDYRTRRVVVVDSDGVYYGSGRMSAARDGHAERMRDLPDMLRRCLTAITEPEGVLMIGGGVTLADIRQPDPSDWSYTTARPWTTYVSAEHGRIVHVGVLAEIDYRRCPLFHPHDNPDTIASMLDSWHAHTGTPWRATGGVVGVAALRQAHQRAGRGAQPLWRWTLPAGVRSVGPLVWGDPRPAFADDAAGRWVHVFDVRAQYLSALRNAALAWGPLEHTGDQPYDMGRAGFWQIDVTGLPEALTSGKGRPPVVPVRLAHKGAAWVSGEVMRYLCQCGWNPAVLDSWSTGNTHAVARSYAERLSAVRLGMTGDVPVPVRESVKRVYTELVGMLGREGGRIYRRDWQIGVTDLARMNFQRRLDRAADLTGLWPFMARTDAAYYLSDDPSPEPLGDALGIGVGMGKMRHVQSVTVDDFRAQVERQQRGRVASVSK